MLVPLGLAEVRLELGTNLFEELIEATASAIRGLSSVHGINSNSLMSLSNSDSWSVVDDKDDGGRLVMITAVRRHGLDVLEKFSFGGRSNARALKSPDADEASDRCGIEFAR